METTVQYRRAANGPEWPTWLLIVCIYGLWSGLLLGYNKLPVWISNPALIVVTAWFMSLQHELLHGHPTRHAGFNRLLGLLPLSAWYPFDIYRDSHLLHHRDSLLTLPEIDPESNYVKSDSYARMGVASRALRWSMRTLAGRWVLGPALTIALVWIDIVKGPRERGLPAVKTWAVHLLLLAALLWWVHQVAGISPLHYLLGIAYPALGLAMIRSFFEHRPAQDPAHRIVIKEAGLFWRLLFLNNNLHAVHHHSPRVPWYRLPTLYFGNRERFLRMNHAYRYASYAEVFRRYFLARKDDVPHPMWRREP